MSSKTSDKIGLTFSVKLSVLYALFFVISSIGLFLVTYYLIHDLVEQREREIISSRIDEYRAWYEEGGIRALKTRFDQQSASTGDCYFVRIVSPRGNALFVSIPKGFDGFDATRLGIIQPTGDDLWVSIKGQAEENAWTVGKAKLSDDLTLQVGKEYYSEPGASFLFQDHFPDHRRPDPSPWHYRGRPPDLSCHPTHTTVDSDST